METGEDNSSANRLALTWAKKAAVRGALGRRWQEMKEMHETRNASKPAALR